jgi:hypothetical protein
MRFSASLQLSLPGDVVLRTPTFWDRLQGLLRAPDLSTDDRDVRRDLLSITEGVCDALREARVTDAVFLAIDRRTAYHDAVGVPNDAAALLSAAQAERLRAPFGELRAVFTHEEDGLETLYEATLQRRFRAGSPAALLHVGGRMSALRPRKDEPLDQARERVHEILQRPAMIEDFSAHFDESLGLLRQALQRAFPEGSVSATPTVTSVARPAWASVHDLSRRSLSDPRPSLRPRPGCYHQADTGHPYYFPWDCYFLDHGATWTDLTVLDSLLSGGSTPPAQVDVVDAGGALICGADTVSQHAEAFAGVHEAASLDFLQDGISLPLRYIWDGLSADPASALSCTPDLAASGTVELTSTIGVDLISTGADLACTGSDLISTGADLASTGADLLTVGADSAGDLVSGAGDALSSLGDW